MAYLPTLMKGCLSYAYKLSLCIFNINSECIVSFQIIYGPKKDPVWVYLEREMIENIDKKPYNEKVGSWLKFLKDLRYFFYCEGKHFQLSVAR